MEKEEESTSCRFSICLVLSPLTVENALAARNWQNSEVLNEQLFLETLKEDEE